MLERKQRVFSLLVAPCVDSACVCAFVNVLGLVHGRACMSV